MNLYKTNTRQNSCQAKMDIPSIRVDLCSDEVDREVETLNSKNRQDFLQRHIEDCFHPRTKIIADNIAQETATTTKTLNCEVGGCDTVRNDESYCVNGFDFSSIFNIRPAVPRLHLDFPSSELSPNVTNHSSPPASHRNLAEDDVSKSTVSLNRLSPNYSSEHVQDTSSSSTSSLNELDEVKVTADRLKLSTRRPSYVAWQEMYINKPLINPGRPDPIHEAEEHDVLTDERRDKINQRLEWITTELMEMRSQDKTLARQFLSLRKDINKLKLQKSCREHEDLLDDAQDELEELQELSEMCDFPLDVHGFRQTLKPLKQIGVTRLNISARRFSTC